MQLFGWELGHWFRILALILVLCSRFTSAGDVDVKTLVQRAFEFHQKGQFTEALPLLHRAYDLAPEDYFVRVSLAGELLAKALKEAGILPNDNFKKTIQ